MRIRMSSSMRWRNGLMVWVDEVVMALLLLGCEADCLIPQRRKQNRFLNHPLTPDWSDNYRASGLVHRLVADFARRVLGVDIQRCPVCREGRMRLVETLPRSRGPPDHV